MKLILAKEGVRKIEDVDEKFEHELMDCLYSIIVIANEYGVDIEKALLEKMSELEEGIERKLEA